MKVWLDAERRLIIGRGPWHTVGVRARCKTIGGYHYDLPSKTCSWPLTLGTCYRLREVFGKDLIIDPALVEWARREVMAVPNGVQPKVAAAIATRPYQIVGAKAIADHTTLAVLDEGGLGKTLQAFAGMQLAGAWEGRHLVICPKTAMNETWTRQINQWTDGQVFVATGTQPQKHRAIVQMMHASHGARFLVTNPETLRVKVDLYCPKCERWLSETRPEDHEGQKGHSRSWRIRRMDYPELFGIEWDSIIADEADRYLLGLRPQTNGKAAMWAEGIGRLQGRRRLAMTGTPFHGQEFNIFGILHWLEPQIFSAFWSKFIDRYFEKVDKGFGVEITGLMPERREDFYAMLDKHTIRRTREEVRADLPKSLHIDHWVDMNVEQAKQYREFAEQGFAEIQGGNLRSMGVLASLIRLQQLAFGAARIDGKSLVPVSSPKYDFVMAQLASRGIPMSGPQFGDKKFVIVSQFTSHLDWIEHKLANVIPTLKITGDVTGRKRDAAVRNFQSPGGPRVMLLNTRAGGVSIDLDAHCDEMFVLDETFVEDDLQQVRWRIDNRGDRIAPRTFHYIRMSGTIDEHMFQLNFDQAGWKHELLDGRRGVEIASRLLGRAA